MTKHGVKRGSNENQIEITDLETLLVHLGLCKNHYATVGYYDPIRWPSRLNLVRQHCPTVPLQSNFESKLM